MSINFKELRAPFPAEDIEWRIGQAGKGQKGIWAKCLAYIQARAVMDRLDLVCGPAGWKVEYRNVPAGEGLVPGIICRISIRIGDEWVFKEDGAEQTDIESFKGGISSALKRAASAWGIGRYLYDLEAEYAEVSTEKQKGWNYGTTKDKTTFYWLPPQLPGWALPEGASKPGPRAVPNQKAAEPVPQAPKSKQQIVAEIVKAQEALGCSDKEIADWTQELYKKGPKQMDLKELGDFLGVLQHELGRKGA